MKMLHIKREQYPDNLFKERIRINYIKYDYENICMYIYLSISLYLERKRFYVLIYCTKRN